MGYVQFLSTPAGRFMRIVLGLVLLWIGFYAAAQPLGYWIMAFGLIPLVSGIMNVCVIAPYFHAPVHGSELAVNHK